MTPEQAAATTRLEATWHEEIPLTRAMGLGVRQWDARGLLVAAELEPNRNVHGTAFAGSLYAIAALAGWGLLHLELQRAGLDGSIVIADGSIRYHRPVEGAIVARGSVADAAAFATAMARLGERGRARFELHTRIPDDADPAVSFTGLYAVRLRQDRGR